MREEILPKANFRVGVHAETWQEAVQAAGEVLLENGSITQTYIDEMIQAVIDLGPYMVIMPGFALAHAEPSSAVLRNDMSLILLDAPVEFGSENDPVTMVYCVACTDRESHREALSKVARALLDDEIFEQLGKATSVEEAYSILHS